MGRRWNVWDDQSKADWISEYTKVFDRYFIDEDANDEPDFKLLPCSE
jgi:hypothetical protein